MSRSISSSNSAKRFPTSCRRNTISVSSALSTDSRMESSALGSTKHVEWMVFGFEMEHSGSRTGTHTAAPFLWLSDCAADPVLFSAGGYEARGRLTSR